MVTQAFPVTDGRLAASAASVRRSFRRFWPYVRADRRFLLLAVGLLVVGAAAETVAIWMYSLITDDALATADLSGFWLPAGIWAGMALAAGLTTFGSGWLTAWVSERFLLRTRDAVYAHLQTLSPDYLARHDSGDLVARLTSDLEAIDALTASGLIGVAGAFVTIVFYGVASVVLSWQLSVAAFVLAPVIWLAARAFGRRIRVVSREERDTNGEIGAAVVQNVTNLVLVQAYNQQRAERARLHARGAAWLRARVREAKLAGAHTPVVDMAEILCLLLVIGFGIWQIAQHRMTLGNVLAFTVYVGYLYPPLRSLGFLSVTASSAAASSDRIAELLSVRPDVVESPHPRTLARANGEIRFEGVGYHYPGAPAAVREVSFVARPGQLVLVTGASGAGKSTIAKLLLRFADPSAGRIRLDGVDLRELSLESLRTQVSLVPQQSQVFHGSVRDNLAYGRPNAPEADIVAAAMAADAHEFIVGLPEGYHTELDGLGQRLSGGQLQRLALARAILRDSPVLVLDEPTSGLDAHATARVLEPLRRLAKIKTMLLVSHDLSVAPHADLVLMLDRGRLVEQGSHAELLRRGGAYAALYQRHQAGGLRPVPLVAPPTVVAVPGGAGAPRLGPGRPVRSVGNRPPTGRFPVPVRGGQSGRFGRIEPETSGFGAPLRGTLGGGGEEAGNGAVTRPVPVARPQSPGQSPGPGNGTGPRR
ncbi:MAG TPA: ABC transporter ATP-binding protein [Pseudonocardiaceae bacterium]|nr:ABC transporter ATP-binding protein [Pseudonocardiaceae bacterium]